MYSLQKLKTTKWLWDTKDYGSLNCSWQNEPLMKQPKIFKVSLVEGLSYSSLESNVLHLTAERNTAAMQDWHFASQQGWHINSSV